MSKRPRVKMILDMERERDAAMEQCQRAIDGWGAEQEKYRNLKEAHDGVLAAMGDLRKQVDDLRRQRDFAQSRAEDLEFRARTAEANLQRALGWVDAKMDRPPVLEDFSGRPF